MAICSHLAPDNEKSLLYQRLEEAYGEDRAHDIWTQTRGQQFLNKYGDWLSAKTDIPLDAHGEPTLEWVQEHLLGVKPGPVEPPKTPRIEIDMQALEADAGYQKELAKLEKARQEGVHKASLLKLQYTPITDPAILKKMTDGGYHDAMNTKGEKIKRLNTVKWEQQQILDDAKLIDALAKCR